MLRETDVLEFKETITDTFLKTVSAYANYKTGKIVFGRKDNGEAVGLPDLQKAALSIENKINDSLDPTPDYQIELDETQKLVILTVKKGMFPPYFYKGQVYIRHDTSSVPADRSAVMELIMKDKNLSWDELPARTDNLTFQELAKAFRDKIGLLEFNKGTQITLNLYSEAAGYTNAGLLFSDQNTLPGIDIVRFGKSQNEILSRTIIEKKSLISMYEEACSQFELFYAKEVIDGLERRRVELIPSAAFREALANALVHRDWSDRKTSIQILMSEEKIEIASPGGLPEGMDVRQYFMDFYSVQRNPNIAYIFLRLGLIERFGTGIRRIQNSYNYEVIKPSFNIEESVIRIQLPVLGNLDRLSIDQQKIFLYLKENGSKSRLEIEEYCGFSRSKTTNVLNSMLSMQVIGKTGSSRSTKYFVL